MTSPSWKLNIIAYANKPYFKFILPFLFFGLHSNPDSHFEIIVSDARHFDQHNHDAIENLKSTFGERFCVTPDKNAQHEISPNTRRFLHTPDIKSDWVYFADIDILIMEDIYSHHINLINKYNIPFSNIIRNPEAIKPRLTGLHFVKFDDYYPINFKTELDLAIENDEHILYMIMKDRGVMVPADFRIRPELGIHTSLSRDPLGRFDLGPAVSFGNPGAPGWSGVDQYKNIYSNIVKSESFLRLYPHFDVDAKLIFLVLDSIIDNTFSRIEDFAIRNIINKSIFFDSFDFASRDFAESVRADVKDMDFGRAISKCRSSLSLWPQFPQAKVELFFIFLACQNLVSAKYMLEKIMSDPVSYDLFKNDTRAQNITRFFH